MLITSRKLSQGWYSEVAEVYMFCCTTKSFQPQILHNTVLYWCNLSQTHRIQSYPNTVRYNQTQSSAIAIEQHSNASFNPYLEMWPGMAKWLFYSRSHFWVNSAESHCVISTGMHVRINFRFRISASKKNHFDTTRKVSKAASALDLFFTETMGNIPMGKSSRRPHLDFRLG
jgi:hypothetical protein